LDRNCLPLVLPDNFEANLTSDGPSCVLGLAEEVDSGATCHTIDILRCSVRKVNFAKIWGWFAKTLPLDRALDTLPDHPIAGAIRIGLRNSPRYRPIKLPASDSEITVPPLTFPASESQQKFTCGADQR